MKKFNLWKLCKILCMALMLAFALTACGGEGGEGSMMHEECMDGEECGDNEKLALSQHSCWQSSLLELLYKDIGSMTTDVYGKLTAENLMGLMILAFTVWMAWQILKHVSAPTPESIGEFWTKIIRKAAICIVCGTLASSPANIMYAINTFVFPVYVTILEFTSDVMLKLADTPEAKTTAIMLPGGTDEQICEAYVHSLSSCSLPAGGVKMTTAKFPDEPMSLMSCMVCAVSDRLGVGYDIAIRLFAKGLMATITGIFLIVAFTIAKLCFVLYLVNGIFRLNMMIIIMPFLILFYPFEQTRKWTVKGFQVFLSSAGIMMSLGIIVSMTIFGMQKLLIDKTMGFAFGNPDEYAGFGVIAMALIFMGFLIIKSCAMALEITEQIIGYAGEAGAAKKVQALAQIIAGLTFELITWGSGKVVTTAAQYIERVRAILEKYRKIKQQVQKVQQKVQNLAGRK